jgi:LysM repeat protein
MSLYSIKPGDTLSHIAQRLGTSVQALAQANNIQDVDFIRAGDSLRLPGRGDDFVQRGLQGLSDMAHRGLSTPGNMAGDALQRARSLIGRAYGDPGGASAQPVGPNSPFMHCAQFVNAVFPDLPASAPQMLGMSARGATPKPGDVVCSGSPAPWGHVGIMTERGTIIHSVPGRGVHESSRAEFEQDSPIHGVISR